MTLTTSTMKRLHDVNASHAGMESTGPGAYHTNVPAFVFRMALQFAWINGQCTFRRWSPSHPITEAQ